MKGPTGRINKKDINPVAEATSANSVGWKLRNAAIWMAVSRHHQLSCKAAGGRAGQRKIKAPE